MKKRENRKISDDIYSSCDLNERMLRSWEEEEEEKGGEGQRMKRKILLHMLLMLPFSFSIPTSHFSPSHIYIHRTKGSRTTQSYVTIERKKTVSILFYYKYSIHVEMYWSISWWPGCDSWHRVWSRSKVIAFYMKQRPSFCGLYRNKKNGIEMWKEEILIQNWFIDVWDKMSK